MPLNPALLAHVRKEIRKGINSLSTEEPVDLVFLASVLCNFNPSRMVPHWLVICAGAGAGKTRLIETIQPWRRWVFTMVTGLTPGYFLSTKSISKLSPLERIQKDRQRILLSRDATSFTAINPNTMDQVYAQLRDLHDGLLYRESGLTNEPKVYEPTQEERLGWIVAATPDWYAFQRRHHDLGSRFSVYYFDGFYDWNSTRDLIALENISAAKDIEIRADMSSAVITYLEQGIAHMRELSDVVFPKPHAERIAAAVKLAMRVLSSGDRAGDTGKRLYFRAREMACMLAFMHGRRLVSSLDTDVVVRYVFSQLPVEPQRFVQLSVLRNGDPVTIPELQEYGSGTRRIWETAIARLLEVGVIEKAETRGFSEGFGLRFSDPAQQLVRTVALQVPEPEERGLVGGERHDDLAELIAASVEERGLVV